MTRDEILNMPAGREMDALVAEKVMSISIYWQDEYYAEQEGWSRKQTYKTTRKLYRHSTAVRKLDVAYYSTNISASREIAKEMSAKGFWCYINLLSSQCRVTFEFVKNRKQYIAYGGINEEPLAVCRAALLAVLKSDND
jgi:hypothetical protein